MHKDDTPFSYQEAYGVHIRKVQFSSGLAGPKHCLPEDRSGNFHYLTEAQRQEIEWRKDRYYVVNGYAAEGKEFPDPKDNSKYTYLYKEIVILRRFNARSGVIAIYPSGAWETQSSMTWKPTVEHFKK
jgi:hypothetical protein